MDIVYHRNCLDGVYSAYALNLFARSLTKDFYQEFIQNISLFSHDMYQSISQHLSQIPLTSEYPLKQFEQVTENYFHEKPQIHVSSVSMFAGEFFPLNPSRKGNICIIADTSPLQLKHIQHLASVYPLVIIIDHHSSFVKCKEILEKEKFKNIYYFWKEGKCAAQLVLDFLRVFSIFPFNYPTQLRQDLNKTIEYVGKNDLKKMQDRESKQFVLGFYYYQIQLSHHNPWLYKRLWGLELENLFKKGCNIYKQHFQMLQHGIQNCQITRVEKGKFKGIQFLAFPLTDRGITSDLGSILSCLSTKLGLQNVAMIYNKSSTDIRISFRSYQYVEKQPFALRIAEIYGGGGHVCAAGCQITKSTFRSHFHILGKLKPVQKLSQQEIQKILFAS